MRMKIKFIIKQNAEPPFTNFCVKVIIFYDKCRKFLKFGT